MTAFERYAPFIQEYIYRKKWADLREVQIEACNAILDTQNHVLIASGTASGKTEAAFFPMLTLLDKNPPNSVGIIYISPLKALINDQFERLTGLLDESHIPVWPWHGDISQSTKVRAIKKSQGIVQITPESLESLLMRRTGTALQLFSDLQFIVIDEIHALMGTDRGLQTMCLLARLEKIIGYEPRRIGLSATLNDYNPAMMFLSGGSSRSVEAIGLKNIKRTISLCVESFIIPDDKDKAKPIISEYHNFLYNHCHDKKCLIFTNSRGNAEEIIMNMKSIANAKQERDIFYVHHGSVSATLRKDAETALRDNHQPTVAAATLTLELGIDIGDLDSTVQIGAPYSCSSFVQRLGRSGRRTEKSQMMFINLHKEKEDSIIKSLPWDLLRAIAIIQLYMEERWVEPFTIKKKPFSLLVHQTLSILMTYNELKPSELARIVLQLPAFKDTVSQEEYRELLRHMVANEYLEHLDSGGLVVGLTGEKITNHYSFYSVFQTEDVFQVRSKDITIGTVDEYRAVGTVFALAGRNWKVEKLDEERKIIYVRPTKSKGDSEWSGSGGHIHTKIVKRMRQVLIEDTAYPYMRPNAIKLLEHHRSIIATTDFLQKDIVQYSAEGFILCPWVGTKELISIMALLSHGLKDIIDIYSIKGNRHYMEFTCDASADGLIERLRTLDINGNNPDVVLPKNYPSIFLRRDKFDTAVPNQLLRYAYLHNELDVHAAIQILKQLKC